MYLHQAGFKGLRTRRLTQDHLEHFFEQIRRGSGDAISITPRNFSSSFQKRWGLHYVNVVINGNCENVSSVDKILDFSIVDLAYTKDKDHTQWDEFHSLPNPCASIIDIELRDKHFSSEEMLVLQNNAFIYISGYFYKKLSQMHIYEVPMTYFNDNDPVPDDYSFTYSKQFHDCQLVKPPQGSVDYYKALESKFIDLFNKNCHRHGLRQILFDELFQERPFLCCSKVKHEDVLNLYIRIRIYFIIKYFNRRIKEPNFKHKLLCVSHQ